MEQQRNVNLHFSSNLIISSFEHAFNLLFGFENYAKIGIFAFNLICCSEE